GPAFRGAHAASGRKPIGADGASPVPAAACGARLRCRRRASLVRAPRTAGAAAGTGLSRERRLLNRVKSGSRCRPSRGDPVGRPLPAMKIADLRTEYLRETLDESEVAPDPYRQFDDWLAEAVTALLS